MIWMILSIFLLDLHGFFAYLMDHLVIECVLMYIKNVKYHGKAMNEKPTMGYMVSPFYQIKL